MAYMNSVETLTFVAGQALATPFIFVTQAADGQIDPTGDGLRSDGVLLTTATAAGEAVTVAVQGRVKVKSSGVIALGAAVASTAAGLAQAAGTGDVVLGYAEEVAAADQIITVRLNLAERVA